MQVLMAIEPRPNNWSDQVGKILSAAGFNVQKNSEILLVWDKYYEVDNLIFSDGYCIRSFWLAPKRTALSVTSKRLYFDRNREMDKRAEYQVLQGMNRPDSPVIKDVIENQWRLIQILKRAIHPSTESVALKALDIDLERSRIVKIGANNFFSPPENLNMLYRNYGFDHIPCNLTISVCSLEFVPDKICIEYIDRLKRAAKLRHADLEVKLTRRDRIVQRIEELKYSGEPVREGHCVLFILPSKQQQPQDSTIALFRELRKLAVPFRRAYADDQLSFSIADLFVSLIVAAGGLPHRSPTQVAGSPVWTIGVDLSHRKELNLSILVLTLVNPDGRLVGAWSIVQSLDETARAESIKTLLTHCRRKLSDYDPAARIIVLRDGRMFENEDTYLYREILKTDLSLFEFRKRGNPLAVTIDSRKMTLSDVFAAYLPGTSTLFLTTARPRKKNILPKVTKVTWHPEWNGLGLSMDDICEVLTASATAPGLGLHARNLPAAIYWADGIAGVFPQDLRFVGVPVTCIGRGHDRLKL